MKLNIKSGRSTIKQFEIDKIIHSKNSTYFDLYFIKQWDTVYCYFI